MSEITERLAEDVWRGFRNSPFVDISRRDAESIAATVLDSPTLRDLLAAAWDAGYDDGRDEAYAEDRALDFVAQNPYRTQESK